MSSSYALPFLVPVLGVALSFLARCLFSSSKFFLFLVFCTSWLLCGLHFSGSVFSTVFLTSGVMRVIFCVDLLVDFLTPRSSTWIMTSLSASSLVVLHVLCGIMFFFYWFRLALSWWGMGRLVDNDSCGASAGCKAWFGMGGLDVADNVIYGASAGCNVGLDTWEEGKCRACSC